MPKYQVQKNQSQLLQRSKSWRQLLLPTTRVGEMRNQFTIFRTIVNITRYLSYNFVYHNIFLNVWSFHPFQNFPGLPEKKGTFRKCLGNSMLSKTRKNKYSKNCQSYLWIFQNVHKTVLPVKYVPTRTYLSIYIKWGLERQFPT